ncbi:MULTISPECIES: hypothetical protein [Nitrosomonas]|nr:MULTISPECIES: hypothetical protein [Nitrosomonas]UVS60902.1 hypothetical protein NX761_15615 [Nitrosomonas sp. PLL12]
MLYDCFVRWSRVGVFNHILAKLAGKAKAPDRLMVSATTSRCTAQQPAC